MFTGADVKGSGGFSHICGAADITTGFIHDIGPGAICIRGFYRAFSQLAGRFLRCFPCQLQDCVGSRVDQANHTQTTMFKNALDLNRSDPYFHFTFLFGYTKSPFLLKNLSPYYTPLVSKLPCPRQPNTTSRSLIHCLLQLAAVFVV